MAKKYSIFLLVTIISLLILGNYQYIRSREWWSFPLYNDGLRLGEVGDKVIVMAKLAVEDTSWVEEHLAKYTLTLKPSKEYC